MGSARHGLARVLSKLGWCSRSVAFGLIHAGRVRVNGIVCRDPERPTDPERDAIQVEDERVAAVEWVYLMLNKPRGLVTTTRDEKGRRTVYECLSGPPWSSNETGKEALSAASGTSKEPGVNLRGVMPVGRLDQASEGLLLFTNDTTWAAHLTDPNSGVPKTYHVQIDRLPDAGFLERMQEGVVEGGERLEADAVAILRTGQRNAWLEVTLAEGRNRHLRRMIRALGSEVLRLVRVRVGDCDLGLLPKARYRLLTPEEVQRLATARA
ncbi:MAG: rRNA pseudouridine synthase [Verrucomicrobiales bacterium]|nr:rRNA pseudouridine synthase [Verrucomicrobiales bacterium]